MESEAIEIPNSASFTLRRAIIPGAAATVQLYYFGLDVKTSHQML